MTIFNSPFTCLIAVLRFFVETEVMEDTGFGWGLEAPTLAEPQRPNLFVNFLAFFGSWELQCSYYRLFGSVPISAHRDVNVNHLRTQIACVILLHVTVDI